MTEQISQQVLQNSSTKTQFQRYNFPQSSKNLDLNNDRKNLNNNLNFSQKKNQSNKENFTNDQFSFQASLRVESQNSKQSQLLANLLENEQNKKYFSIFSKNGLQSSQKKNYQNTSQPASTITYQKGFETIENKYKKQSKNSENVSPTPYLQPSVSKETPQILSQKVNFCRNFNRPQQPENQFDKKKQNLLSQINNNLNYTEKFEKFSCSHQQFAQSTGQGQQQQQYQNNLKNQDQLFCKKTGDTLLNNTNQFQRNYSSNQQLELQKQYNNHVDQAYSTNFDVKKYDFGKKQGTENNQLLQQQPSSQLKIRYLSPDVFQQQEQRRTSLQQQQCQLNRNSCQQIPDKNIQNYYNYQQQTSEFDRNQQFLQLNNNPFLKNNSNSRNREQQIYMNTEENQLLEQQKNYSNNIQYQQMQNPIEFSKYQQQEQNKQFRQYTPQISQNKQIPYQEQQQEMYLQQQQQQQFQNQNQNNLQKFQTPNYQNYQYQTPSSQNYHHYNNQEQMSQQQQKQLYVPQEKIYQYDNFNQEIPTQKPVNYQNFQFQGQNAQIPQIQITDKIYTPRNFNQSLNQQFPQQFSQQQYLQQFPQQQPDPHSTAFLNNYFSKNQNNQQNFQIPSIQNQINPVDYAKNLNLEQEQQQEVVVFLECLQEKLKIEKEITNIKKELGCNCEFSVIQIFKLFDNEKYGIINCENFIKGVNQYFDLKFTKQEALKILRRNCQSDYDPKLSLQEFSEIFVDKDQKIIVKQQLNVLENPTQFDVSSIRTYQKQLLNLFNKILRSEDIQEKLKKKVSKGSKLVDILQFSGHNIYY